MSLLSSLLRLPQRGLVMTAVATRHRLRLAGPRPDRNGGQCRGTPRRAAAGRAVTVGSGLSLSAFFLFSGEATKKDEGDTEEGEAKADAEDAIILLLKKAKLNIMKGELEEAERILHEAAWLSQQSDNKAAIIYTYDMMANLAFMRGQLEHAEKLFKATMSYLLAGDVKQVSALRISNKLFPILFLLGRDKLALAGYQFCILTLEEKIAKQKDLVPDALPEEERVNTHLLLAMSLDSYARYLLAHSQAALAQTMYERALQIAMEIHGETHPQTVVVMSDLATALDSQGLYDEAHARVSRAAELAQQTEHPEAHVILNNLAGILVHKGDYSQARRAYRAALEQAEKSGDGVSVRYIEKELAQLAKRKRMQSKASANSQVEDPGKAGAEARRE
ncbi:tetratricopeptide repeat protein 19, mitochondrial [Python bivittatus]|uniref:Tetratricopeptide repeat protein 19, mitochondrial n=1 Tax=Python bivittatus TaxID=176946 RepID=A0A9F2R3G4_PYTBI|nr:tetratricopeptide repeat protein 19, mitochondrial [Python bivittatus]